MQQIKLDVMSSLPWFHLCVCVGGGGGGGFTHSPNFQFGAAPFPVHGGVNDIEPFESHPLSAQNSVNTLNFHLLQYHQGSVTT